MSEAMERLRREVAETRGIIPSVRTLLAGLSAQVRDLRDQLQKRPVEDTEAELNKLADELDANQSDFGVLVQQFQPADPPAAPAAQPTNEAGYPIGGAVIATPPAPAPAPEPVPVETQPESVPVETQPEPVSPLGVPIEPAPASVEGSGTPGPKADQTP